MKISSGAWGIKPLKKFSGEPAELFQVWLKGQVPIPQKVPFTGAITKPVQLKTLIDWSTLLGGSLDSAFNLAVAQGVKFDKLKNKVGHTLQDYRDRPDTHTWAQALEDWQKGEAITAPAASTGTTVTAPTSSSKVPFAKPLNISQVQADIDWAYGAYATPGGILWMLIKQSKITLVSAKNDLGHTLLDYHLAAGKEGNYLTWNQSDFQAAWVPWSSNVKLQVMPPAPPTSPKPPLLVPKNIQEVTTLLEWGRSIIGSDKDGATLLDFLGKEGVNLTQAKNDQGHAIHEYYAMFEGKPDKRWLSVGAFLGNIKLVVPPPFLAPKTKDEVKRVLKWAHSIPASTNISATLLVTVDALNKCLQAQVKFGSAITGGRSVDWCSVQWGNSVPSFGNLTTADKVTVLRAWLVLGPEPPLPTSSDNTSAWISWVISAHPLIAGSGNGYAKLLKLYSGLLSTLKNTHGDTLNFYAQHFHSGSYFSNLSVNDVEQVYVAWFSAYAPLAPVQTQPSQPSALPTPATTQTTAVLTQRVSQVSVYSNPKPLLQKDAKGHVIGFGNDDPRVTDPITYADVPVGWPATLEGYTQVGRLSGSTGALLVKDAAGKKYVMKKGGSPGHIENEIMVDRAYQASGVLVPKFAVYKDKNGKTVKVAEFIEGRLLGELKGTERDEAINQLEKGYAMDAFLSNWDVYGAGGDNVLVDAKGEVWRIDNGGALAYRAEGGLKTREQFNAFTEELWTMRRGSGSSVQAFNGVSIWEVEDSINRTYFTNAINALPTGQTELREMLKKRRDAFVMTSRHIRAFRNGDFKEGYAEETARAAFRFQRFGIRNTLSGRWKLDSSASNAVNFVDADKRKFGGLMDKFVDGFQGHTWLELIEKDLDRLAQRIQSSTNNEPKSQLLSDLKHTEQKLLREVVQPAARARFDALLAWCRDAIEEKSSASTPQKFQKWLTNNPAPAVEPVTEKGLDAFAKLDARADEILYYVMAEALGVPLDVNDLLEYRTGRRPFPDLLHKADALISKWKYDQKGSSSSTRALAMSYALMSNINTGLSPGQVYTYGLSEGQLKQRWEQFCNDVGLTSDQGIRVISVYHQFTQEMLDGVAFAGNDADNQVIRLVRTASRAEIAGNSTPITGQMYHGNNRGPLASFSLVKVTKVNDPHITVQAMPRSRIVGTYWQRRGLLPWTQSGSYRDNANWVADSFMGVLENEFVAVANGVDMVYRGTDKGPVDSAYRTSGDDVNQWGVPLTTLREKVKALITRFIRVKNLKKLRAWMDTK